MNDKNLFLEAFDAIDDEFLAEAKHPSICIAARRKKIMISSIAACVAAVLVAIPSVKILSNVNDNNFTASDDIEIIYQEDISYIEETNSKEQVSSQQAPQPQTNSTQGSNDSSDYDSTNIKEAPAGIDETTIKMSDLSLANTSIHGPSVSYEKIYSPSLEYLNIEPIPTKNTVAIYENYYERELDFDEVSGLSEKFFNNFSKALNIPVPQYDTRIDSTISIHSVYEENQKYSFEVRQSTNRNIFCFFTSTGSANIYGKEVTINGLQSDFEITNAIEEIKNQLFNIYGVTFADTKIIREYDDYATGEPISIEILFYNNDEHPLNHIKSFYPRNNFVSLIFLNHRSLSNSSDTQKGDYLLYSIVYASYRTTSSSDLRVKYEKGLLPLEKAEKYLQKGYVLFHKDSSNYQTNNSITDFTNYDYASFEYAGGYEIGDLTLPYYAFYKNIGTAENGNMIFAKAYVPAVEVEGYEEYFINKHSSHNNNSDDYVLDKEVE